MTLIASDQFAIIVGLGKTGLSVARFLTDLGQRFAVVDTREAPPELGAFQEQYPEVPVVCGALDADYLCRASVLYVSPGVPLATPAIQTAAARGVALSGDIDLFSKHAQAPIVAITGSNAKSTVTTLVGEMAHRAGKRVAVGGNLGVPALDLLSPGVELYVLELSSFQLETTQALNAAVATCLNLSEDHMDRYSSMATYHLAKHRIFRGARHVVINRDDPLSRPLVADQLPCTSFGLSKPDLHAFGRTLLSDQYWLTHQFEPLLPVSALKMRGTHNHSNALAALALGQALGLPMVAMLEALQNFPGLAHRCQWVATHAEVAYYNDSKATNVGAALAAIEGLGVDISGKLLLIAGGDGKGADFKPLNQPVVAFCRALILIGRDAERLAQSIDPCVPQLRAASLEEAVQQAAERAQPGDAVLLSPACASLDMFRNFEARGQCFVAAVGGLCR